MKHSDRTRILSGCIVIGMLFFSLTAISQEYPAREVDRPITVHKGILKSLIDFSYLSTGEFYDEDGSVEDGDNDYQMTLAYFGLNYGLTNNLQVGLELPFAMGEFDEADGGGLGDIAFLIVYQILSSPQVGDLGVYLKATVPTGNSDIHIAAVDRDDLDSTDEDEFLDQVSRDKFVYTEFRTGDPQTNYRLGASGRLRSGRFGMRAKAEYIYKAQARKDIDMEGGNVFNVVVDPGDGYRARLTGVVQITDLLAASLGAQYIAMGETTFDDNGLGDDWSLLSVVPEMIIQPTADLDIFLRAEIRVSGHNTPAGVAISGGMISRFDAKDFGRF